MSNVAISGNKTLRERLRFLLPYRIDLGITVFIAAGLFLIMGIEAVLRYLVLGVLEVSFSFDNAIVNALVLAMMAEVWRKRFMVWGVLCAVVGMRFAFPVAIVSVTGKMSPLQAVNLAFAHPDEYAAKLDAAHPLILTLSGIFLLMIGVEFLAGERDHYWLKLWKLEERLAKVGRLDSVAPIVGIITVLAISEIKHSSSILAYGVVAVGAYMVVTAVANLFENEDEENTDAEETGASSKAGNAGIGLFFYLLAQDATFSFDSVGGGFSITTNLAILMLGLGIGVLFVMTMTVHLLDLEVLAKNSKNKLIYLEHGAYYAITALAVLTLAALFTNAVPDFINGLVGVVFIGLALRSSRRHQKQQKAAEAEAKRRLLTPSCP